MFVVYILENRLGQNYIGQTNSPERRLLQHNDESRHTWTAKRGPWEIVFEQECDSRSDAVKLERHLKSFKNKNTLNKHIAGWRKSTSQGS